MKSRVLRPGAGDLFIEALIEPFEPPTDSNYQRHTIHSLAIEARTNGAQVDSPNEGLTAWEYKPEWGGGALATAHYLGDQGLETLAGLTLKADKYSRLDISGVLVYPMPGSDREADLYIRAAEPGNVIDCSFELELGEKLTVASLAVAQFAGDFFSQIA